jgi:hypothetical protein
VRRGSVARTAVVAGLFGSGFWVEERECRDERTPLLPPVLVLRGERGGLFVHSVLPVQCAAVLVLVRFCPVGALVVCSVSP